MYEKAPIVRLYAAAIGAFSASTAKVPKRKGRGGMPIEAAPSGGTGY